MSPRLKSIRKVMNPPVIKGFKPYGGESESSSSDEVVMLLEEYEAIRLCDYDMIQHHAASAMMGVSRPTFTRIYAAARQKVARAFVEGLKLRIEGGKVYFDSDWYRCHSCGCYFNNPAKDIQMEKCPLCGKCTIDKQPDRDQLPLETASENPDGMMCMCPACGYQDPHTGSPCHSKICPQCGVVMRRLNGDGVMRCGHGRKRLGQQDQE